VGISRQNHISIFCRVTPATDLQTRSSITRLDRNSKWIISSLSYKWHIDA